MRKKEAKEWRANLKPLKSATKEIIKWAIIAPFLLVFLIVGFPIFLIVTIGLWATGEPRMPEDVFWQSY